MHIAILTFDGFDELDTFIVHGLLNRASGRGWRAELASPGTHVTSMNGVTVQAQQPLEFANAADAVVFGGGIYARSIADPGSDRGTWLDRLELDPVRQSIGGVDSGVLLMARLGLLADIPACTDLATKPWLVEAGVRVEDDASFRARGPVATAGGAMASPYLAAWLLAAKLGMDAAAAVLALAAPVGERDAYVKRLLDEVRPFIAA